MSTKYYKNKIMSAATTKKQKNKKAQKENKL